MMLLQIYFNVAEEQARDFERMYQEIYVPALNRQQGYISSKLLRLFPPAVAQEIEAAPTEFNYQIELVFDTEANRRRWAASADHAAAWPAAAGLAKGVAWRGFDVAGSDR
jgi:heme-degrading monooxygenase HmoA